MRYRPTVVEVDLEAVRHNVRRLKPPAAELMAVVKADGENIVINGKKIPCLSVKDPSELPWAQLGAQ